MPTRVKQVAASVCAGLSLTLGLSAPVFAHVAVKPASVPTSAFQTFTMGVPNEKDQDVTGVRLLVPGSLKMVSPTVKPGWAIDVKKSGNGDEAVVQEIIWTGGKIPAGQRDDFTVGAQAPAASQTLVWKAYQTYADGTVISWDQPPTKDEKDDDSAPAGPYSQTDVTNKTDADGNSGSKNANLALGISILAAVMALVALYQTIARKR
jgi:uncharacterized protein YcnI